MKINVLGAEYSVTVSNGTKAPRLTDEKCMTTWYEQAKEKFWEK